MSIFAAVKDITLYIVDLEGVEHRVQAPTDMNLNVMEAIRMHELQIKATCGGMAMCATCNVRILSDHELHEMSESEEEMLDEAFVLDIDGSRLACQIPVSEDIDGLKLQLGELTAE